MSRTKNAGRNIIWGVLNKIVSLGLPFATRTVMIYTMGMNYVGLGSLFTSILQVLSFAELGIGSALVFSMYKPIAEDDTEKVCALLNFYRKTYRRIGLIIFILGLVIMPFLNHLIAGDLPDGINIYVLFSIYLLNNLLGYFLFAYKYSLFTASQRTDMLSKISTLLQMISSASQIIILVIYQNYYVYVIVVPIITCLNNILIGVLTNKYYPNYKCRGNIEERELKVIEKKVKGMIFQKIGGIVLSSVDTIIISAYLGLITLGIYQNYYYVVNALFSFLSVIMVSIIPGVGNSIATKSINENLLDFRKFNLLYFWIVTVFACCMLTIYQPFMYIWVGKTNMVEEPLMLLFVVYFFIHKWMDMGYVYQEAAGLWWENRFVPLIAAFINLSLNLLLVKYIGLYGILLSTIVAVLLIYNTGYPYVLFKYYFGKGLKIYAIKQFIYLFIGAISIGACFYFGSLLNIEGVCNIILRGIIGMIVPNVVLCVFLFKTDEFKLLLSFVKKIKKD